MSDAPPPKRQKTEYRSKRHPSLFDILNEVQGSEETSSSKGPRASAGNVSFFDILNGVQGSKETSSSKGPRASAGNVSFLDILNEVPGSEGKDGPTSKSSITPAKRMSADGRKNKGGEAAGPTDYSGKGKKRQKLGDEKKQPPQKVVNFGDSGTSSDDDEPAPDPSSPTKVLGGAQSRGPEPSEVVKRSRKLKELQNAE
jgi:hypothetical protein